VLTSCGFITRKYKKYDAMAKNMTKVRIRAVRL
jgi:ribosomal protein L37E